MKFSVKLAVIALATFWILSVVRVEVNVLGRTFTYVGALAPVEEVDADE